MKKNKLLPNKYLSSTYDIDFAKLYQEGYRGIIFDVDNTLVPHGAPADERAISLFLRLNELGFSVMLLSNNKEPRVKSFCEQVKYASYMFKANKPNPSGYLAACDTMNTTPANTLFVGDQIFTDIWGANRAGIYSILVEPVLKWREEPQIVLKRLLEAIVLLFYKEREYEDSNC